jgi:pyruvate dehydrogenase E2 component (dihydrolipoamide acetyltransferase)
LAAAVEGTPIVTGTLFSLRHGDRGPALVLVHGFGASHAAWDPVTVGLTGAARTTAYDLPGHGSSLDAPGAGQAKAAARAILEDMATNGIDRFHVAGHSMGGAVAALMALVAPERVASLTLLAPGGFGEAINGKLLRRYAAAAGEAELAASLAAMSGPDAKVLPAHLLPHLAMRARAGQLEKLAEIVDMIARDDRQGVIPRDSLARLPMPVSVLWGTEDTVLPFAQASDLPPHFQLQVLSGAGHMLIEERPDTVLETIRSRLADSSH